MVAIPSRRSIVPNASTKSPRTFGSQLAKMSRVNSTCARTGWAPKELRTRRWPFLLLSARVTNGDEMTAAANSGLAGPPSPMVVAAVATSTTALARSWNTSGRWVASDMMVMPPIECPANTTSRTSVASSTSDRSFARVSMASGAVPLVLNPWPAGRRARPGGPARGGDGRPGSRSRGCSPSSGGARPPVRLLVARQVPDGERGAVWRAHDPVVGPGDPFTPAECVTLVVGCLGPRSLQPAPGDAAAAPAASRPPISRARRPRPRCFFWTAGESREEVVVMIAERRAERRGQQQSSCLVRIKEIRD